MKYNNINNSFIIFTEEKTVLFKMSAFGPIATFQVKLVNKVNLFFSCITTELRLSSMVSLVSLLIHFIFLLKYQLKKTAERYKLFFLP